MKRKIVAAMCALAVLCTSANVFPMSSVSAARKEKAVGTTYYISNRGDNQNSGTSEGEAWQTLDKLKDVKPILNPPFRNHIKIVSFILQQNC